MIARDPAPSAAPARSALPLWIALCCCAGAAALVFGNTLPALQERRDLEQLDLDLHTLSRRYDEAIRQARLAGARGDGAPGLDLQSLFVAIDQKGYTVAEFCAAHASERPADAAAEAASAR
ncbi:MAG: hypothetical protein KDE27_13330 [Planctomycetes bacterium]|nr:hypothetical protein [Planctomycetota bacterium]